MRKFFVFNINDEMTILSKKNPYNIYKALEQIYKMKKNDLIVGTNIYEQLVSIININKLSDEIFNQYKNNDYYSKFNNRHTFYNKYRPERTKMIIKNSYLVIESDAIFPDFLKCLSKKQNFFACDFENKDYFWLDELVLSK